jgi:16S rRNA processing protein RimM
VDSRCAAENLRDSIITVERAESEVPEEDDEYYDSNLIGCEVRSVPGELIGTVTDVLHLPSQEVLVVVQGTTEHLIPFVESIVPNVDIGAKRITIDAPEGLLNQEVSSES